jgi:hypothetical protein
MALLCQYLFGNNSWRNISFKNEPLRNQEICNTSQILPLDPNHQQTYSEEDALKCIQNTTNERTNERKNEEQSKKKALGNKKVEL